MPKLNPILFDIPAELIGERIVVRPFRDEDAEALWHAVDGSREHLTAWMPWVHDHQDLEFARTYVRRMQAKWILREDFTMGIFGRDDGRLLGATGLHRINWSVPALEIGYWIRAEEEGQGYVTEAVMLVRDLVFTHLHGERLIIMCNAKNERSAAVPPRAGFVHESTMRAERRDAAGELCDAFVFVMTRADFDALPKREAR